MTEQNIREHAVPWDVQDQLRAAAAPGPIQPARSRRRRYVPSEHWYDQPRPANCPVSFLELLAREKEQARCRR